MSERPTIETAPFRAEVYFRGDTYGVFDAQQEVLQRVKRLEANATFSDSLVESQWQRIRSRAEDVRDGALATYEEFREWALANGYTLEPAFEQRTRSYLGLNRVDEVVVFPVITLAIYDGHNLQAVFPCSDDDRAFTVGDALDAFERGDDAWLTQFSSVPVDRTEPYLDAVVEPAL